MARASIEGMSPFFIVSDVAQTITFYRDKLGFEVRLEEPAGSPGFAIVGRARAQLFLKSQRGVPPLPNPKRHPWMRWDAYLSVPEPDVLAAEFAERHVAFNM